MRYIKRVIELQEQLHPYGFSCREVYELLLIEKCLWRWAQKECGNEYGCIERDERGIPYWHSTNGRKYRIRDAEKAALKRLARLMEDKEKVVAYHQKDPRGPMIYIVEKECIEGHIRDNYTKGVAIC